MRGRTLMALAAVLAAAGLAAAADAPPLLSAHGTVDKVTGNTLTIKPRMPNGRFGPNIVLKATDTSEVRTLSPRNVKGKTVMTQRRTDLKDLKPGQAVAVLYTLVQDSPVLLTAVAQPAGGK